MEIRYLADCPEVIPALACQILLELRLGEQSNYTRAVEKLQLRAIQREAIPLTLVAFEHTLPVGMVSLIECDLPSHVHLMPWVASFFVATPYQGRGIGRKLMETIESCAIRLGFGQLYLFTWTAEGFYSKLGWTTMDSAEPERFPKSVVMQKRLSQSLAEGGDVW